MRSKTTPFLPCCLLILSIISNWFKSAALLEQDINGGVYLPGQKTAPLLVGIVAVQVQTLPYLPTNTLQVPITTGTVTDSGSEYTGFIEGDKSIYIPVQGR